MLTRRSALALFGGTFVVALTRRASAEEVPADLMHHLAAHAAAFERMKTHASFAYRAEVETLDGSENATSVKAATGNVVADGKTSHLTVTKYTDNGVDQTAEARKLVAANSTGGFVRMPFHAKEQSLYDFEIVEHTTGENALPRVRIAFTPNASAAGHVTITGSAWVDTNKGTVVNAHFVPSASFPMVDRMEVDMAFDASTSLGPAVSRIAVTGRTARLLGHVPFRGKTLFSGYKIAP